MRTKISIIATAALVTLAQPGAAGAAQWNRVTSEAQPSNTSEVGLERTADGVLHVLWPRDSGGTEQAMHSAIAVNGKSVSGPHQVVTTPNFVNNSVDLVPGPSGGLRAFVSGVFPSISGDAIRTATAGLSGTAWSAHAAASQTAPGTTNAAQGSGIGAAVSTAGVPWSAWGDSSPSGGGFHAGIDPAVNDIAFGSACCERDPNVAYDPVGGVFAVGWNFLGTGTRKLQVLIPFVAAYDAPNSGAAWTQQRIGLTGRIGAGGIYAAYGSGANAFNARPALWRVGDASAKVIGSPPDAEHTTLAPAPGGRLWVAWEGKDRGKRLFATRTNPQATRFGAIVSVKPPSGTDQIHRLNVEGSRGFLDLVALANRGSGDIAHWHNRLQPGLTLKAKPKKVKAGKKVKFKVEDAGDPVAGAKVKLKLGTKKLAKQTNGAGKAKIKVPGGTRAGRYKARATKGGYAAAKRKVKVLG